MMRAMARVRTIVTIDLQVLQTVRVAAKRAGKSESQVIEEALRRDLGFDLLDRLWARNAMRYERAEALALKAQHATRPRRTERV